MTFEERVKAAKEARQHITEACKGILWAWNATVALGLPAAKETQWFLEARLRLAELDADIEAWLKEATKPAVESSLPYVPGLLQQLDDKALELGKLIGERLPEGVHFGLVLFTESDPPVRFGTVSYDASTPSIESLCRAFVVAMDCLVTERG